MSRLPAAVITQVEALMLPAEPRLEGFTWVQDEARAHLLYDAIRRRDLEVTKFWIEQGVPGRRKVGRYYMLEGWLQQLGYDAPKMKAAELRKACGFMDTIMGLGVRTGGSSNDIPGHAWRAFGAEGVRTVARNGVNLFAARDWEPLVQRLRKDGSEETPSKDAPEVLAAIREWIRGAKKSKVDGLCESLATQVALATIRAHNKRDEDLFLKAALIDPRTEEPTHAWSAQVALAHARVAAGRGTQNPVLAVQSIASFTHRAIEAAGGTAADEVAVLRATLDRADETLREGLVALVAEREMQASIEAGANRAPAKARRAGL